MYVSSTILHLVDELLIYEHFQIRPAYRQIQVCDKIAQRDVRSSSLDMLFRNDVDINVPSDGERAPRWVVLSHANKQL